MADNVVADRNWNDAVRPGESDAQRLDRNFDDLLQELRVSQNGTQILFAFLLTVPFSNGLARRRRSSVDSTSPLSSSPPCPPPC